MGGTATDTAVLELPTREPLAHPQLSRRPGRLKAVIGFVAGSVPTLLVLAGVIGW